MLKTTCKISKTALSIVVAVVLALSVFAVPVARETQAAPTVPTLVVKNGSDVGNDSLRDVIAGAKDGDTITFAPGVTTVTLTTNELSFSKSLTIDGGGVVTIKRSSSNAFRLIRCSADLTLRGLTLENGSAPGDGAGVNITGNAVIENCVFTGNQTDSNGGGLRVAGNATLYNCTFVGNTAGTTGGGLRVNGSATLGGCTFLDNIGYSGGGAYIGGAATLTDCAFAGNSITNSTGSGGGLYIGGATTLTDCLFHNNFGPSAFGSGAYISGVTTLSGCVFTSNRGSVGVGLYTRANTELLNCAFADNTGMSVMYTAGANVTAVNTTFFNNLHPSGTAGDGLLQVTAISGVGGDVNLTHCTFARNQKGFFDKYLVYASGNITAENCLFTLDGMTDYTNQGIASGGANVNTPTYAAIFGGNTLTFNYLMPRPGQSFMATVLAGYETDAAGNSRGAVGASCLFGAVNLTARSWLITSSNNAGAGSLRQMVADAAAYSTAPLPDKRVVYFDTGAFHINLAAGSAIPVADDVMIIGRLGAGGKPEITVDALGQTNTRVFNASGSGTTHYYGLNIINGNAPSSDNGYGGGINSEGTVAARHCVFENNNATGVGGGVFAANALTLAFCDFSDNTGRLGGGGAFARDNAVFNGCRFDGNAAGPAANVWGGGLFANTATLRNCAFVGNAASGGSVNTGGGAVATGGAISAGGCSFFANTANGNAGTTVRGGALEANGVTLTDCSFSGNTVSGGGSNGGGAAASSGITNLTGCVFTNNATGGIGNRFGGGLFLSSTSAAAMLNGCTFTRNTAGTNGGGLFSNGPVTMNDCKVIDNTADNEGGGAHIGGVANMTDCTLSENKAGAPGGGLFTNANATLTRCAFNGNQTGLASAGGGFMALADTGLVTLVDCTFTENSAGTASSGGGLYTWTPANLTRCTFTDNEAGGSGGGLYAYRTLTLEGCGFSGNTTVNSGGAVIVRDTTNINATWFTGNVASSGGAVHATAAPPLTITNATLSGNRVNSTNSGAVHTGTVTLLTHCTITNNHGGGLFAPSGAAVTLSNSILTGNTDAGGTAPRQTATLGTGSIDLTTGQNLIEDRPIPDSSPAVNVTVRQVFGFNAFDAASGTHKVLTNGIAAGTATAVPGAALAKDQLGAARPTSGAVTYGAVEAGANALTAVAVSTQPTTAAYAIGDTASLAGTRLTLTFTGDLTEAVDYDETGVTNDMPSNITATAGSKTVRFTFLGVTSTTGADITVAQDGTTTTLTSSQNPSVFGQSVTFTATVTTTGSGTPSGTVKFYNGETLLGTGTLSSGVAAYTTSALVVGSHGITAVYDGDTNHSTSTATEITQVVNKGDTTTSLAAAPASPQDYGTAITLTATVTANAPSAGTPTGTVTFYNGTAVLAADVALDASGIATFEATGLGAGSHDFSVVYSGDGNFNGSTGTHNNFSVEKATPSFTTPTGLTAIYGETLANVPLPAGFSWEPATTTSVGDAGDNTFTVKFVPTNTANFNEVTGISVTVAVARKPIPVPTAATGLVYNGTAQTGVGAGTGYTVLNNETTSAGTHEATVTPDSNHQWNTDENPTQARSVSFVIAQAPVTVTADDQWKYLGDPDPALTFAASPALLSGDTLTGRLKHNGVNVGSYDIVQDVPLSNPNYTITFVKGTMTIKQTPATQEGIDAINALPNPIKDSDDADKVTEVTKKLEGLSEGEQSQIPQNVLDKLDTAQEQAGEVNNGGDLPWYARLYITPVHWTDPRYDAFAARLAAGRQLVVLYDIRIINTVTGADTPLPEGEVKGIGMIDSAFADAVDVIVVYQNPDGVMRTISSGFQDEVVWFDLTSDLSPFGLFGVTAQEPPRPKTGEGTPLVLPILLTGFALVGLAVLRKKRRLSW
ncbi:MAG: Ig-like domain repeat protein [Clostridiales bacterium]|nr:Ig-like domain repeat protein [Clostridiales bacterium]